MFIIKKNKKKQKNLDEPCDDAVDDVLEVNFNFPLTNDVFLSPNHKTLFDFTLAYPWNVQIQFKYSAMVNQISKSKLEQWESLGLAHRRSLVRSLPGANTFLFFYFFLTNSKNWICTFRGCARVKSK